jgi:hypothetical protein
MPTMTDSPPVCGSVVVNPTIRLAPLLLQRPSKHSAEVAQFASRKIGQKKIDRSNATVPGDDKIGSCVSWWFAGSARYASNPSDIT